MVDSTVGGADVLGGGAGDDDLRGEGFDLFDGAEGGDDTLAGGDGDDRLYGEAISLLARAVAGNGRLAGGDGDDLLYGDGNDASGNVVCGNDRLEGGAGNDLLYGDVDASSVFTDLADVQRGDDTFAFARGLGRDTVLDFENGRDHIDLLGNAGIDGFADVAANARQRGANTLIDLGAAAGGPAG